MDNENITEQETVDEFAAGFDQANPDDNAPENTDGAEAPESKGATDDAPPVEEEVPEVDPWAGLNETQLAAVKALQDNFKSEQNRAIGQQRHAKQLAQELADRNRTVSEQPEKTVVDIPEALAETFPEVAETIRSLEKQNASLATAVDQRLAPMEQVAREQAISSQEAALAQAHPDWKEIVAAPEFAEFVNSAPPVIFDAFSQNQEFIVDAGNAGAVVGYFKALRGVKTPNPNATQSPAVDELESRRAEKLKAAQSPAIKEDTAPRNDGGIVDDFDAGFAEFQRKNRRT